eukprot:105700_1
MSSCFNGLGKFVDSIEEPFTTKPSINFCFRTKELFFIGHVVKLWLLRVIFSNHDEIGGSSRETFEQKPRTGVYCHRDRRANIATTNINGEKNDKNRKAKKREYSFDRENTIEPRSTG